MLPSPSDLTYFLEVAEAGNISRAAERLGITQPSLSLSIKRSEEALGSQLLIRSKTGVHLTPTGYRFRQQAKLLLDQWESLKAETLKEQDEVRGQYVLGCHTSVGLYSLPQVLPNLLKEYPNLEIQIKHDLSRKITEEVISFRIDLGIVVNPVSHPDLVIKQLANDKVSLWQGPQKLINEDILLADIDLNQSQSILKKLKSNKLQFRRIMSVPNLEMICSLVSSGTGIGILPERVARRLPSQGLKPYPKASAFYNDKICLIYRSDTPKTLGLKQIIHSLSGALS